MGMQQCSGTRNLQETRSKPGKDNSLQPPPWHPARPPLAPRPPRRASCHAPRPENCEFSAQGGIAALFLAGTVPYCTSPGLRFLPPPPAPPAVAKHRLCPPAAAPGPPGAGSAGAAPAAAPPASGERHWLQFQNALSIEAPAEACSLPLCHVLQTEKTENVTTDRQRGPCLAACLCASSREGPSGAGLPHPGALPGPDTLPCRRAASTAACGLCSIQLSICASTGLSSPTFRNSSFPFHPSVSGPVLRLRKGRPAAAPAEARAAAAAGRRR